MQLPFVTELFTRIGADPDLKRLTRFIDTNGFLGPSGWASVLEVTDGVMLDIKAFDPARHKRLTGKDNARVLASARLLHAAGKLHELRYLMIPGETDREDEVAALEAFVTELGGPVRLRLNAFRNHGVKGEAADWPPMERETLESAAARLKAAGVGPLILPTVYV
jgi:pyruvate formate lyase activating enzyme